MEFKTKFSDFSNDYSQLIGKYVLLSAGQTYSYKRKICTISKITKTGFKINGDEKTIFRFDDGQAKGIGNRRANWSNIHECKLLTDEEKDSLLIEFKKSKEIATMRVVIKEKFDSLTYEQLKKIYEIVYNEKEGEQK